MKRTGNVGTFDSAVIEKEDGKVHVHKTEKPTQHGAWTGIVVGESKIEEQIEKATKRARKVLEKQVDADAAEFKRELEQPEKQGAAA
jgi:hypothetical protein